MLGVTEAWAVTNVASTPTATNGSSLLVFIAIFAVFYWILLRPQYKRNKAHRNLVNNLAVDDEIITNGGVFGRVVKVADDFIILEVAQEVKLRFQKAAVHAVVPKGTLKLDQQG